MREGGRERASKKGQEREIARWREKKIKKERDSEMAGETEREKEPWIGRQSAGERARDGCVRRHTHSGSGGSDIEGGGRTVQ